MYRSYQAPHSRSLRTYDSVLLKRSPVIWAKDETRNDLSIRISSPGWTIQSDYFICAVSQAIKLRGVWFMSIPEIDLTWIGRLRVRSM